MDALGGSLAPDNRSSLGEHDEVASPIVACGMDACAADVVGYHLRGVM
jgi:hypothetical protein